MPIALLLENPFVRLPTLIAAAKGLGPWVEIVRTETVLFARVRGAFITSWFGASVPRDGSQVQIAFANQAELDRRLAEALGSGPHISGAASVTTPAAALAGMVIGTAISPVGQAIVLYKFAGFSWISLVDAAVWLLLVGLLIWFGASVVVGGLSGVGLAVSAAALLLARGSIEDLLGNAAAAAWAMNEITELVGLLLGPRAAVVNPAFKAVLLLGDQLGALAAQLLGAIAFAFDQVGPRLHQITQAVVSIRRNLATTLDALTATGDALLDDWNQLTKGDWAIESLIMRFVPIVAATVAGAGAKLLAQVLQSAPPVIDAFTIPSKEIAGARRAQKMFLDSFFNEHPTVTAIRGLMEAMTREAAQDPSLAGSLDQAAPVEPVPDAPGLLQRLLPPVSLPDADVELIRLTVSRPVLPDAAAIQKAGVPAPPILPTFEAMTRLLSQLKAGAAVEAIAQRPSIFAAERRREQQALTENHAALVTLAARLSDLVGDFLTPSLWDRYAPQLNAAADRFVGAIYGQDAAPQRPDRPLPVRRADEPVPVRPVVGTLRLRAPGSTAQQSSALRDRLLAQLNAQTYVVAPATWGS